MKTAFSGWRYLWKSQDIRRKLLVTLLVLVIYRLAANVPVPGINQEALSQLMQSSGGSGMFLAFLDLLSGGTISNFSLLAMGVYPYITAQIIIQLLTPIFPALQRRMEEDPREGRKWMEKWTYYLAVPMAARICSGAWSATIPDVVPAADEAIATHPGRATVAEPKTPANMSRPESTTILWPREIS